jgi:hypothetical protein
MNVCFVFQKKEQIRAYWLNGSDRNRRIERLKIEADRYPVFKKIILDAARREQ